MECIYVVCTYIILKHYYYVLIIQWCVPLEYSYIARLPVCYYYMCAFQDNK